MHKDVPNAKLCEISKILGLFAEFLHKKPSCLQAMALRKRRM